MTKIAFAGAIAITALMCSSPVGPTPSKAQDLDQSLTLAQADVQGDQDRYRDRGQYRGERRQRSEREGTVGIGPGVRVGPRSNCRTVIKSVRRGDRTITSKERRCD